MAKKTAPALDASNMSDVLYRLPEQIKQAVEIGESAPIWRQQATSNRYVIFGLGGSAIGGDLLRSYLAATEGGHHLDISVRRGYDVPAWLNSDTNVICSSYSGETEETLSAFDHARRRTMRILSITTGGSLGQRSVTAGMPIINIPPGYQPRCALAFSFFPLLTVMGRYGAVDPKSLRTQTRSINETIREIEAVRDEYASKSAKNPALALAKKLHDHIPVVYSANERLDAVNLRWRGQIQENAKQLAFGNLLPEMNHNEINGWQFPAGKTKQHHVILLRDPEDHVRVSARFDALRDIVKGAVSGVIELRGSGKSLLSRMFTLIYLADWTSYHLALLNGVDPSPVPVIQKLKATLAKVR
ncbi:MAG: bifunctional phosphoglucose/phosphomannose isomerase [Bradyrhizobiaceae bacterium]|nr:bifunctional phosphoglucose/phosphomannose isomerase [Bradyrhizobiaceae bacterium]